MAEFTKEYLLQFITLQNTHIEGQKHEISTLKGQVNRLQQDVLAANRSRDRVVEQVKDLTLRNHDQGHKLDRALRKLTRIQPFEPPLP